MHCIVWPLFFFSSGHSRIFFIFYLYQSYNCQSKLALVHEMVQYVSWISRPKSLAAFRCCRENMKGPRYSQKITPISPTYLAHRYTCQRSQYFPPKMSLRFDLFSRKIFFIKKKCFQEREMFGVFPSPSPHLSHVILKKKNNWMGRWGRDGVRNTPKHPPFRKKNFNKYFSVFSAYKKSQILFYIFI